MRPVEIRVRRASRRLEVDFEGGERFTYPAEYLRVESPSAEVQGHTPADHVLVYGKADGGDHDGRPDRALCDPDPFRRWA